MKTKDAKKLAGSGAALARLLGVTQGAISQWGEDVPDQRIWQLKVLRPKWFKPLDAQLTEAAKAGLIERRSVVRRAEDRAMRGALKGQGA